MSLLSSQSHSITLQTLLPRCKIYNKCVYLIFFISVVRIHLALLRKASSSAWCSCLVANAKLHSPPSSSLTRSFNFCINGKLPCVLIHVCFVLWKVLRDYLINFTGLLEQQCFFQLIINFSQVFSRSIFNNFRLTGK